MNKIQAIRNCLHYLQTDVREVELDKVLHLLELAITHLDHIIETETSAYPDLKGLEYRQLRNLH